MGQHCPTCTCGNCANSKRIIWERGRDSADKYPGSHKPAAKNISKVAREGGDTYYVDLGRQEQQPRPTQEPKREQEPIKRSPNPNSRPGAPRQPNQVPALKVSNNVCPTSGKPPTLTPEQRQQIIRICQQNPQDEEIGGFIEQMPDGSVRITQEPNIAPPNERHNSFGFSIDSRRREVIGVWHRHVKRLGHDHRLSGPDIDAARRTGLSSYVVWDVGEKGEKGKKLPDDAYLWDEYHPNGAPNTTPTRSYSISFTCPTAEQIMQKQKEAVGYIEADNKKLQQAVAQAAKEIQDKQREVLAVATKTLATTNNVKTKSEAIAMRLKLAPTLQQPQRQLNQQTQPKQLPPGTGDKADGTIWMGQRKRQSVHARQ